MEFKNLQVMARRKKKMKQKLHITGDNSPPHAYGNNQKFTWDSRRDDIKSEEDGGTERKCKINIWCCNGAHFTVLKASRHKDIGVEHQHWKEFKNGRTHLESWRGSWKFDS